MIDGFNLCETILLINGIKQALISFSQKTIEENS